MRLSVIFELLLICLLIAFSAYGRVIDRNAAASLQRNVKAVNSTNKQNFMPITLPSLKQAEETMNKHCYCNENVCNCCRNFRIPLVPATGPGCASLQYLQGDNLQVQLSFGNAVLTTQTISGKNPKPICVTFPGGFSKFCGKVYSIKKEADRHFKACLGLELQSGNELEASLRVSCFRFGPEGLKLTPAEEFPVEITPTPTVEEDDDDDIFGLDDDEDDDDEEEEDDGISPEGQNASNPTEDDDDEEDDEDDDVLGFEALLDIFTGDDDTTKKPKVTSPIPILQPFTVPVITTAASAVIESNNIPAESIQTFSSVKPEEPVTVKEEPVAVTEVVAEEISTDAAESESVTELTSTQENEAKKPESAEQLETGTPKPEKVVVNKHKKVTPKPAVISTVANNEVKKPIVRPSTPDPAINDVVPQEEQEEEEDDDDEDDILGTEDLDEEDDDEDDEKDQSEEEDDEEDEEADNSEVEEAEDVKDEDLEEELADDDDDEEEDEALSALVGEESEKKIKSHKQINKDKIPNKLNEAGNPEEDDADYGYSLSQLLARKTPKVSQGRQSKVMRL